MTTPARLLRTFKHLELIAAAIVLALGVFSIFFWTTLGTPTGKSGIRYVCLASGGIDVLVYPRSSVPVGPVASVSVAGSYSVLLWPKPAAPIGGSAMSIPLWMLLIPPLVPGLIRLARRALMPKGLCRHCRYDLRGLDSSCPCPECGESRAHATPLMNLAARA